MYMLEWVYIVLSNLTVVMKKTYTTHQPIFPDDAGSDGGALIIQSSSAQMNSLRDRTTAEMRKDLSDLSSSTGTTLQCSHLLHSLTNHRF